jgi:hypothetical protein
MAIFNNLEDPDKKNQQVGSNAPAIGPATSIAPPTTMAAAPQAGPQKGSGRFTNIQSYLNANKNAGNQLSQGIGSQVQKKIEPIKTQAQSYNDQVRSGIQSAQGTIAQGQGQVGQLKQIGTNIQGNTGEQFYGQDKDLGINAFTQSPDFNQFQRIQSGAGVNEDVLNLQQQAFQNQTNALNQSAKNTANQAGSETGRFGLLKQSFGGNVNPQYTQGQQRLDQMFLQRQGLGDLKQQLNQNVDVAQGLQAQTQQTGQGVRNAQEAERSLMGDINTQASANEADYLKMLESYAPELQRRRDKEFSDLSSRYSGMKKNDVQAGGMLNVTDADGNPLQQKATQAKQGLTADDLKLLGVDRANSMFDVFDKTNLDMVARTGAKVGQNAKAYQDVATQKNADDYSELAKILKLDPGSKKITGASNIEKSVQALDGQSNLQNRLTSAKDEFFRNAGQDVYAKSLNGGVSGWTNQHSISAADVLAGRNTMASDRGMSNNGKPISKDLTNAMYSRVLNDIKKTGFGNILGTGGEINDALTNIDTSVNSDVGMGGLRDSGGTVRNYNTNMDEQIKQNLAALGVDTSKVSNLSGKDRNNVDSEFIKPTISDYGDIFKNTDTTRAEMNARMRKNLSKV